MLDIQQHLQQLQSVLLLWHVSRGVGGNRYREKKKKKHSCWHSQAAVLILAKLLIFFSIFWNWTKLKILKNFWQWFGNIDLGVCFSCGQWKWRSGKIFRTTMNSVPLCSSAHQIVAHDLATPDGRTYLGRQYLAFHFVRVCVFTSVLALHILNALTKPTPVR